METFTSVERRVLQQAVVTLRREFGLPPAADLPALVTPELARDALSAVDRHYKHHTSQILAGATVTVVQAVFSTTDLTDHELASVSSMLILLGCNDLAVQLIHRGVPAEDLLGVLESIEHPTTPSSAAAPASPTSV